ncbi:MAG: spore cortex-lytic enzyme [Tissierellia bacterium]|nr:spore cortex-lytic enzyme [Tissierellia bacterium]
MKGGNYLKRFTVLTSIFLLLFLSIQLFFKPTDDIDETAARLNAYAAPRVLYWGTQGQDVKNVQWQLVKWKYLIGPVDGIYGPETYRAVRRFQAKNGLKVDGVVGPQTAAALGIRLSGTRAAQGINRRSDEYLLARAVHGEARGEPYIGKVAVAAVILNRTRNPKFPNTIAGVIYQPLAFTAVADGQINLTPDKDSIKAARDALNGWDPTYGCLYYWNPATATSKWIWSRKVTLKIGKHWFGI